jgi:hypothetical protein
MVSTGLTPAIRGTGGVANGGATGGRRVGCPHLQPRARQPRRETPDAGLETVQHVAGMREHGGLSFETQVGTRLERPLERLDGHVVTGLANDALHLAFDARHLLEAQRMDRLRCA